MIYYNFLRKLFFFYLFFVIIGGIISCDYVSSLIANEKDFTKEPLNILFIGNSFTLFNDGVDRELSRLFTSSVPKLHINAEKYAIGGERLSGHYKKGNALKIINSHNWDIVVIQEYSNYPISNKPDFYKYATLFREAIDECGAETMLFMTWAYKGNDEMTPIIAQSYYGIGNELGCRVTPVGLAFQKINQNYPEIELYSDYKHSSKEGTYLAACCFYAMLTEKTPVGINYTSGIDLKIAEILQQTAWDVVGKRLNSVEK